MCSPDFQADSAITLASPADVTLVADRCRVAKISRSIVRGIKQLSDVLTAVR